MRDLIPFLTALLLLLPPVGQAVQEAMLPVYRPMNELRALIWTYRWCTLKEIQESPPDWSQEITLPEGRLRLRGAFPGDDPQELVLEGNPTGEILVDDRGVFAGRIVRSAGRLHTARTLFSPGLCVNVRVGDRALWGLVCGGQPPVLLWVPVYVSLSPGETLRTAGFSGVPENLLVGVITQVETSRIEPGFFRAEVEPFARYHTTLFFWSTGYEISSVDAGVSGHELP